MKITIDCSIKKIIKVEQSPIYFGNNNVDKIILSFINTNSIKEQWYPSISAIGPDKNPIYPRSYDTDGITSDNDVTNYEFTLSQSNGWNLIPGKHLFYIWMNYPNINGNECIGSFACTILSSSGYYQIDNPVINPKLREYLDSTFDEIKNDLDEQIKDLGKLQPKGTATSSVILAKTSADGIWIGTDTSHWYYWNGTKYVDGGQYFSTGNVITHNGNQLLDENDDNLYPNIMGENIPNSAVTETKIQDGAVTRAKLANNSVTEGKISDGAVTENKIADYSVTTSKIADGAVTRANLSEDVNNAIDAPVTTSKLADGSVTTSKLANNSVTENKIVKYSVTKDKISDGAVTRAKLADEVNNVINNILMNYNNIKELIPNQASSDNQLADKDFVNSSIDTSTATFQGTFDDVSHLPTEDDGVNKNDYAYIDVTDELGNRRFDKYKYTIISYDEPVQYGWVYEYTLNNSSFTEEQWKAINSGITVELLEGIRVNKVNYHDIIDNLETALKNKVLSANQGVVLKQLIESKVNEVKNLLEGKQNALATDNTINLVNDEISVNTDVISTKDYVHNSFATNEEMTTMLEEVFS